MVSKYTKIKGSNSLGLSYYSHIDIDYDNIPKSLLAKIIEELILDFSPFHLFEENAELAERLLTQFLEKSCARVLGIQEDIEKQNKRT